MDIIEKIRLMGIKQSKVVEMTKLSKGTVSQIMNKKIEPSLHVLRLLELAFEERKPYINPTIEAVTQIMEQLPPEAQAEVLKAAEKEKVFVEVGKGK